MRKTGLVIGLIGLSAVLLCPATANAMAGPWAGVSISPTDHALVRDYAPPTQTTTRSAIRVDVEHKTLFVFLDGKLYKQYAVALGRENSRTPIGNWKVIDKQKNWGSGFGSRWIGLNVPWGIYGIHGTNKPYSIGYFASGGCIRMHNSDVDELYEWVKVGTPVIVQGNPLKPLRLLREGDIGADVLLVQQRLQRLGYYEGECHGRFDVATEDALSEFEDANGLPVNGRVEYGDYVKLKLLRGGRS